MKFAVITVIWVLNPYRSASHRPNLTLPAEAFVVLRLVGPWVVWLSPSLTDALSTVPEFGRLLSPAVIYPLSCNLLS